MVLKNDQKRLFLGKGKVVAFFASKALWFWFCKLYMLRLQLCRQNLNWYFLFSVIYFI